MILVEDVRDAKVPGVRRSEAAARSSACRRSISTSTSRSCAPRAACRPRVAARVDEGQARKRPALFACARRPRDGAVAASFDGMRSHTLTCRRDGARPRRRHDESRPRPTARRSAWRSSAIRRTSGPGVLFIALRRRGDRHRAQLPARHRRRAWGRATSRAPRHPPDRARARSCRCARCELEGAPIAFRIVQAARSIVLGSVVVFGLTVAPLGLVARDDPADRRVERRERRVPLEGGGDRVAAARRRSPSLAFVYGLKLQLPIWPLRSSR